MPEYKTKINLVKSLNAHDPRSQSAINSAVAELAKHSSDIELNELEIENSRLMTIEGQKTMGIEATLGAYFMSIVASVIGAWLYDVVKIRKQAAENTQLAAPTESQVKLWVKEAVAESLSQLPKDTSISETAILKVTKEIVVDKRLNAWHEIFNSATDVNNV